jgi:putative DNA primase/helicase
MIVSFGGADRAIITRVAQPTWPEFASWLTRMPGEYADKELAGWYIPAEFDPVYRHSENFVARHAITFDFDRVNLDTWGEVILAWESTAFAIYTTFNHTIERPRFRVVLPLARPAGFDEFQAVSRKVGADVGIELIARESFVPAQMMYCPARSLGGLFSAHINDGALLDVDTVLAEYEDWTDRKSWPHRRDGDPIAQSDERIDPREKPGIIGQFNRAFTISQAIEKFELPYRRVR